MSMSYNISSRIIYFKKDQILYTDGTQDQFYTTASQNPVFNVFRVQG